MLQFELKKQRQLKYSTHFVWLLAFFFFGSTLNILYLLSLYSSWVNYLITIRQLLTFVSVFIREMFMSICKEVKRKSWEKVEFPALKLSGFISFLPFVTFISMALCTLGFALDTWNCRAIIPDGVQLTCTWDLAVTPTLSKLSPFCQQNLRTVPFSNSSTSSSRETHCDNKATTSCTKFGTQRQWSFSSPYRLALYGLCKCGRPIVVVAQGFCLYSVSNSFFNGSSALLTAWNTWGRGGSYYVTYLIIMMCDCFLELV